MQFHTFLFDIHAALVSQFKDSVVCVLVQVDKDLRHPLLLEQPSLQAAISSWHTDFELQEIFRKGRTQPSPGFMMFLLPLCVYSSSIDVLFRAPAQNSNLEVNVHLKFKM